MVAGKKFQTSRPIDDLLLLPDITTTVGFYSSVLSQKSKNRLGTRIIELRKAKEWSQSDLAAKVGVSYAQIGRYEAKDAQPPAAVLKKIAEALDTTDLQKNLAGVKEPKSRSDLYCVSGCF